MSHELKGQRDGQLYQRVGRNGVIFTALSTDKE